MSELFTMMDRMAHHERVMMTPTNPTVRDTLIATILVERYHEGSLDESSVSRHMVAWYEANRLQARFHLWSALNKNLLPNLVEA